MSHKTAAAEWAALQRAVLDLGAACDRDDRFTLDDPPTALLVPVCRRCPARAACGAYGRAARPTAGFWAGDTYAPPARRPKETAA